MDHIAHKLLVVGSRADVDISSSLPTPGTVFNTVPENKIPALVTRPRRQYRRTVSLRYFIAFVSTAPRSPPLLPPTAAIVVALSRRLLLPHPSSLRPDLCLLYPLPSLFSGHTNSSGAFVAYVSATPDNSIASLPSSSFSSHWLLAFFFHLRPRYAPNAASFTRPCRHYLWTVTSLSFTEPSLLCSDRGLVNTPLLPSSSHYFLTVFFHLHLLHAAIIVSLNHGRRHSLRTVSPPFLPFPPSLHSGQRLVHRSPLPFSSCCLVVAFCHLKFCYTLYTAFKFRLCLCRRPHYHYAHVVVSNQL